MRTNVDCSAPRRDVSQPLPDVTGLAMGIEATVKKPMSSKGRVVSDAMVEDLRTGRALHRGTLGPTPLHSRRLTLILLV